MNTLPRSLADDVSPQALAAIKDAAVLRAQRLRSEAMDAAWQALWAWLQSRGVGEGRHQRHVTRTRSAWWWRTWQP